MRLLLPVVLLFALGTDSNAAVDLNVTDLQLSVAGENLRIGVYSGPEVSSDQPPFTFSATVELRRGSSTIQVITLGDLFGESTVNCESCMGSCSGGCSIRVIEKDFPGGCEVLSRVVYDES
jgi:hypothetical protein